MMILSLLYTGKNLGTGNSHISKNSTTKLDSSGAEAELEEVSYWGVTLSYNEILVDKWRSILPPCKIHEEGEEEEEEEGCVTRYQVSCRIYTMKRVSGPDMRRLD